MLTKMTEADWAVALDVFRASLPRRGDKGIRDTSSSAHSWSDNPIGGLSP
jgi:hypothetical protein